MIYVTNKYHHISPNSPIRTAKQKAANSGFFCFAAYGKRFFLLFLYDVEVTESVQDAVFVY